MSLHENGQAHARMHGAIAVVGSRSQEGANSHRVVVDSDQRRAGSILPQPR